MASIDIALLLSQRLLLDALGQLLPLRGHRVLHACATRDELFASLDRTPAQLLVVDLESAVPSAEDPHESGIDAVKVLRAWHPEMRLLTLATNPEGSLIDRVHQTGAHGLLDKNESNVQLVIQALESIAAGSRFFPVGSVGPRPSAGLIPPSRQGSLTDRELEVLRYVAVGADNLRIAQQLQVSERTVRAHVSALYRKLAARNRVALALHAGRMGLTIPEL